VDEAVLGTDEFGLTQQRMSPLHEETAGGGVHDPIVVYKASLGSASCYQFPHTVVAQKPLQVSPRGSLIQTLYRLVRIPQGHTHLRHCLLSALT
jgi:hypothetical protein